MKIEISQNKSLKQIRKEIHFCIVSYSISSILFFLMHYTYEKQLINILVAHIGLYITTSIAYIVCLVLVQKYLRIYLLPITFCAYLFAYNSYHHLFCSMYSQLSAYARFSISDTLLVNSFFLYFSFAFFIMSTWHISLHLFRIFRNLINKK